MSLTTTDATLALREHEALHDAIREHIRFRSWYRHRRRTWPATLPGRDAWLPDERRNEAELRALLRVRRVARQSNERWS